MTKKIWIALTLSLLLALSAFPMAGLTEAADTPAVAAEEPAAEEPAVEVPAAEEAAVEAPAAEEAAAPFDMNAFSSDFELATVNGQAITMADAKPIYDYYMQQYAAYGMDFSTEENQRGLLAFALNLAVQDKLLAQKALELGFMNFTDAERGEFEAKATETYNSTLSLYKSTFAAEGKDDAAVTQETEEYLAGMGFTLDKLIDSEANQVAFSRMFADVTKDVAVTDAEVEAAFNERVEAAKESAKTDPSAFENDIAAGNTIYYTPEGYRTVKHILVMTDNAKAIKEQRAKLAELEEGDPARAEAEAELEALMADVQPRLDEIQAKIDAGTDFQQIIDQYGEDGGMREGLSAQTGYYMATGTTRFVPEFTAGGMALEKVGDISEPILTDYGFHIIRYNADVPAGAIDFEEVKQALSTELKDAALNARFGEIVNEWAGEAQIEFANF